MHSTLSLVSLVIPSYIGAAYILQEFPGGPGRFKGETDFRIFLRHRFFSLPPSPFFLPLWGDAVNHTAGPSRPRWRVLGNLLRQFLPGGPIKMLALRRKTPRQRERAPVVRADACTPVMRELCESVDKSHPARDRFPQKIHGSTCASVRRC